MESQGEIDSSVLAAKKAATGERTDHSEREVQSGDSEEKVVVHSRTEDLKALHRHKALLTQYR